MAFPLFCGNARNSAAGSNAFPSGVFAFGFVVSSKQPRYRQK
jgi:lipopolysaccharide export LptBFGC system permease protein LptF